MKEMGETRIQEGRGRRKESEKLSLILYYVPHTDGGTFHLTAFIYFHPATQSSLTRLVTFQSLHNEVEG